MDRNNQPPGVDPVDLLSENYEGIEMSDAYRRDILLKTRAVVTTHRRIPIIRWAAGLAGTLAVIAVFMLAWHFLYPAPQGQNTAPGYNIVKKNAPRSDRKTNKKTNQSVLTCKKNAGRNPVKLRPGTDFPDDQNKLHPETDSLDDQKNRQKPDTKSIENAAPLVAVIQVQQPVINGSGKEIKEGDKLPANAVICTGDNGRITMVTRKGSELRLGSNSRLVFKSDNIASISKGRLYCSNRNKEIARIDTPAGRVKLLGTIVDTAVVRKDTVAVTVVEGKVQLSNSHGSTLVDAGKRSVMVAYNPPQAGVAVNTHKETSWYHGKGEYQSDFGDITYTVTRGNGLISELWVMKANCSSKHRIRSFIGGCADGMWLPGERWLSIQLSTILWTTPDSKTRTANTGSGHPIVRDAIVLLDAATGETLPFNLPDDYDPLYASFAPDPSLVAFCGSYKPVQNDYTQWDGGVWVYDNQTGNINKVLNGWVKTPVAWAPDSRHIAVSTGQEYTNDHKLVIIDSQTGETEDLGIIGAGASFSPDGTKIAYCAGFRQCGSWFHGIPMSGSIFVKDLTSNTEPVQISSTNEWAVEPRWSPDGSRIVYLASGHSFPARVCIANANGTEKSEIYHIDGDNIAKASWAPSGNSIYVTVGYSTESKTMLVAADGSGVIREISADGKESKLSKTAQKQTDSAIAAIKEAVFQYAMGKIHSFEADIPAARQSYDTAADIFAGLTWNYPLAGLGTDDTLRYADAAEKEAARSDADILHDSCKERMNYLGWVLAVVAGKHKQFPADLPTLIDWAQSSSWGINWLFSGDKEHVAMLGTCPGNAEHGVEPYIYTPPVNGTEPKIGDVLISCPLHPDVCFKLDENSAARLNETVVSEAEPGECSAIRNTPYLFLNTGDEPLTVIHHLLSDSYEIKGKAKLLPTGKVYSNETVHIESDDEGSIARFIDAAGTLDWGGQTGSDIDRARDELEFCRCVARYEAGLSLTDCEFLKQGNLFKAVDGEPAKLLFCSDGKMKGSWGASGSDLRFEYVGPGSVEMYQLKPSGRFRVSGIVKVQRTGEICKNGWIDKDGKIISSEK